MERSNVYMILFTFMDGTEISVNAYSIYKIMPAKIQQTPQQVPGLGMGKMIGVGDVFTGLCCVTPQGIDMILVTESVEECTRKINDFSKNSNSIVINPKIGLDPNQVKTMIENYFNNLIESGSLGRGYGTAYQHTMKVLGWE